MWHCLPEPRRLYANCMASCAGRHEDFSVVRRRVLLSGVLSRFLSA